MNTSHLDALQLNLSHERVRCAQSKSAAERELRAIYVAQMEREIAAEKQFLGLTDVVVVDISDDELFAELIS